MKNKAKTKIVVGIEKTVSNTDLDFLKLRFDVTTISFEDLLKNRSNIHLLFFNGGADVDPSLYGENVGSKTTIDKVRDSIGQQVLDTYYHTPKLGICRGAQFLTVAAGGKLIQHVEGHTVSHNIDVQFEGNRNPTTYAITSTHHQMMYPFNLSNKKYELLGWSKECRSNIYLNGENQAIAIPNKFVEPEIIFYPSIIGLAIQGHPEYANCSDNTKTLCLNLIEEYLIK